MLFTYQSYLYMVDKLRKNDYEICNYHNYERYDKCVILRHDVDNDLMKALMLAKLEQKYNIKSTYYFLLSSNFYNIASKESLDMIHQIDSMGHEIGLHFDEKKYEMCDKSRIRHKIIDEIHLMEAILNIPIKTISMHRPSEYVLENDLKLEEEGYINSYNNHFFKKFKYLSDSRMHWREDVLDIIKCCRYNKLHILTHPFWYSEQEKDMKTILFEFVENAKIERWNNLNDNFRDLKSVLSRKEIDTFK